MIKGDPKVSIVIVHYKNKKVLFQCLQSVKKNKAKISVEVIVVDNDERRAIKRELLNKHPWVNYVKSPGNVGYGAGNNLGASIARGKYLLVLNPDTKVFPETIDNLVSSLDKNKDAAIVSPNYYHKNLKPYEKQGSRSLTPLSAIFSLSFIGRMFPNNPISRRYFLKDKNINKLREVDAMPGSCFLVRKKVFEKVGGFDENFFLFFEEADLSRRIKSLGYKIFMIPNSKIIHLHKKSTPKTSEIKRVFEKSRFYYFRKHFGLLKAIFTETLLRINPYIFLLLAFNLVFFSAAIFKNLYISSADTLLRFPSFSSGDFHLAKNTFLFDPVTQFIPWHKQVLNIYKSLGLPLWNPLNGGGVPLLANAGSAVFFPLNFVYNIFNFKTAILLNYFTKIALIGIFTFYYLKSLGLKNSSSLIGATAFNFAGYNIVWLQWTHTNSIVFLPLLFTLVEKIVDGTINKRLYVYSSFLFFLLFLSGHPESMFHITALSAFYFLIRIRHKISKKKEKIIAMRSFFLSILLGAMLAAFQLFPIFEYLLNSHAVVERSEAVREVFLSPFALIYHLFPNLSGSPSLPFFRSFDLGLSYHEMVAPYIGLITIIVAVISGLYLTRQVKVIKTHLIILLLVLPFIYKIPLLSIVVEPFNQFSANARLIFYLAFVGSILAAFFFEKQVYKKIAGSLKILAILLLVAIPAVPFITKIVGNNILSEINPIKKSAFIAYENSYIIFMLASTAAGLLILYKMGKNTSGRRTLGILAIALIIFLQTGFLNKDYNSAIPKEEFYPITAEIEFLQSLPKGRTIELGGNSILPPDVNIWYEIPSVHNYDAVDIRRYKTLYETLFDNQTVWGTILDADIGHLNLVGAKYILTGTEIDKRQEFNQINAEKLLGELLPGKIFSTTFTANHNDLQTVRLLVANYNRLNTCVFTFALSDTKTGHELFKNNYACNEIPDKNFVEISFPPINDSKGMEFSFDISTEDSKSGNAISLWADNENNLVFSTIYNETARPDLQLLYNGRFRIYENLAAFPEYYFVSEAMYVSGEHEISAAIKDNKYDLRKSVLIESSRSMASLDEAGGSKASIEIIEDRAGYNELIVENEQPGYLVTTNSYYPGWKVYVNGKKVKLEKANYAFYAVYLPEGKHEVLIKYQPESFTLGLVVSLSAGIYLIYSYRTYGKSATKKQ